MDGWQGRAWRLRNSRRVLVPHIKGHDLEPWHPLQEQAQALSVLLAAGLLCPDIAGQFCARCGAAIVTGGA